ncbi:Transcriptional adapter 1 [Branchiostoma belcheri]|nr:Transcriptional adapter 1 [Branchiostoma belcheri]
MNTTAHIVDLMTPYNTTHAALNVFSSFPVSTQTTSVDQSTFETVSIGNTLEEEQGIILPIAASVSGTMFMIAVLVLSWWFGRRRFQRQRAKALQRALLQVQANHSLLHNQMYGTNQQQLDNRVTVPNQAGCAEVQPYAEVPLSRIEESTSQDRVTYHTYTYIKDDVHSARQLVEANQHGDEQGRYETIPNELGCTGVEPYAEIPLSNIAVEPVIAEVECHARDDGKDTNIKTSSLQPSVSDSPQLVTEEIETSQTPGLLDISHGVFQMETVPKGTHVPVPTVTDDEMTDVAEEGGSAVQSTSNETVYQNAADSQESTASGVASLSEKNRQDRKNTVNKTVYGNAADSQESTSSDAALLLEKNRQDRKNTVNKTVYRNTADSQESTSSDVALLSEKNRQDRKNTVNETVYRNAADSQESTSSEAVLLLGQNRQESKNTENGAYCAS